MAASPLHSNAYSHARCSSLPSTSHPFVTDFADQLCRLNTSESTSSSSSVSQKLTRLQDLHDCGEKVLLLPLTQQALAKECGDKWMNEILDGSLRLLDVCSIAKDALSKTMESTHELQLIMCRIRGGDNSFRSEVRKYLTSRKEVKKAINKASKSTSANKICESPAVISMLKELDAATGAVFESLLSFVAGSNSRKNSSSWSLVTKLVQPKRVACEDELAYTNELENVDAALKSLISHNMKKSDNTIQVANVQIVSGNWRQTFKKLKEDSTYSTIRRLIKTRVSLLNIFNH